MIFKKSTLLNADSEIAHVFTTRDGGISKNPFNNNNLAFHVGDKVNDVINNHITLSKQMGYKHTDLVHMRQIHSDIVTLVDLSVHNFDNPPECDALITNQSNIPLMVMVADCTPVLFFDPVQKVVAVAHAGRAGAINGIVPKTITKMCNNFGSKIENIKIVLGPSIGVCCYEVGEKIAKEVTADGYDFAIVPKKGSYYLDVNAIIHRQLKEAGLNKENVEDMGICNTCENQHYFSYRADNQKTGRIAGVIMLKRTIDANEV